MELNMLRLHKKVEAGAKFIQTSAVFDIETFGQWLDAAISEDVTAKAAILAGVIPLDCAVEAERLSNTYTDYYIPGNVIDRLKKAGGSTSLTTGNEAAQKKEGIAICIETIKKLKKMKGLRGIHILCGCKGKVAPEIVDAALS
jgi:methylenetetrahydrofolate reductase (NADPH)